MLSSDWWTPYYAINIQQKPQNLDVEDCPEELLRQQSYAKKNQLGLTLGGILRSKATRRGLWMPELVLYGTKLLAPASLGKLLTNESAVLKVLDQ